MLLCYVANSVPAIFDIGHISVIVSSANEVIKAIGVGAYPLKLNTTQSTTTSMQLTMTQILSLS